jgi:hypothetical protein
MLFVLSVKSTAAEVGARLDTLDRKQIPFASSLAVNALARQALFEIQRAMQASFDRPTPYTLRGFKWTKATKSSPEAMIEARDFAGKGTPAWKYLTPEVFGGTRRMKRFERALEAKAGSGFTVPGRGAQLNAYGNMGEINKILSALGAFAENGYVANRTRRSRQRQGRRAGNYFIAHSHDGGALLGVYKVVGSGHVEPVLIFTRRAPSYAKRLPYRETAEASFKRNARAYFDVALAQAIATARP